MSHNKEKYDINKSARIGSEITCVCCNKRFIKKTKDHVFCSNGRSKGAGNCKDKYWNKVDPDKRCRKNDYYYDVIVSNYAKTRYGGGIGGEDLNQW